jgi:hypothetical protein
MPDAAWAALYGPVEGQDYYRLPSLPSRSQGKTEIVGYPSPPGLPPEPAPWRSGLGS